MGCFNNFCVLNEMMQLKPRNLALPQFKKKKLPIPERMNPRSKRFHNMMETSSKAVVAQVLYLILDSVRIAWNYFTNIHFLSLFFCMLSKISLGLELRKASDIFMYVRAGFMIVCLIFFVMIDPFGTCVSYPLNILFCHIL